MPNNRSSVLQSYCSSVSRDQLCFPQESLTIFFMGVFIFWSLTLNMPFTSTNSFLRLLIQSTMLFSNFLGESCSITDSVFLLVSGF